MSSVALEKKMKKITQFLLLSKSQKFLNGKKKEKKCYPVSDEDYTVYEKKRKSVKSVKSLPGFRNFRENF